MERGGGHAPERPAIAGNVVRVEIGGHEESVDEFMHCSVYQRVLTLRGWVVCSGWAKVYVTYQRPILQAVPVVLIAATRDSVGACCGATGLRGQS